MKIGSLQNILSFLEDKYRRNLKIVLPSLKSFLKDGLKRNLNTFINVLATVILIVIVIFFLLSRASFFQRETAEESLVNLVGITASEVQTDYLNYYNIVRTTSHIMRNYKNIEVDSRRDFLKNIMLEIFESNTSLLNIYTIWKPNELDGMDDLYANTPGTDETGQFISGFNRELGWVEERAFPDRRYILNPGYFDAAGLKDGVIGEPQLASYSGRYRNSWIVDLTIPIVVEEEAVGAIGITINLVMLQFLAERRLFNGMGRTMICTSEGTLIAHSNGQLRGSSLTGNFSDFDDKEPLVSVGARTDVFNNIEKSMKMVEPLVFTYKETMIVSYPLRTIDPLTAAYNANESGFPRWAVVTAVPMSDVMAPIRALMRFSILFIIGAAIIMAFVVLATSKTITQRTRNLQRSLEQSTTMQDNLKYGLFLIDQKYTIQSIYSKALEKIFSTTDLEGKNFLDFISSSVRESEKQGIIDYFDMVFRNAFDKDLLDSINPINEFLFLNNRTGEEKNIRTTFSLAEHGRGAQYILGTMEDITAEKKLQKQLMEAESLKENEMRSLFQVIQIDPRVLRDFVVDAEYEFEKINDLLRNRESVQRDVLIEMYQSVHAVKSNALILNLEDFSDRLHKLESSVKAMQEIEDGEVPFDDFLALILQINDAMRELDQLKDTVSKIENFRVASSTDKKQEKYVLVETLTRVCNKTQAALDKKVRFVVEGIDDVVLDYGPRRDIKEVLTQLVRNAVYHGIERPEERTPLGKDAEGEIRLSIRYRENQIVIKLTDNGGGIDFSRIRQIAEEHNLIHSEDEANDKNYLLKTIFAPGFSTLDEADYHAGRGVGLSLVKDRVKDLHGNINVSTAKGRGTTFTITIPLELPVTAAGNVS